MKNIKYILLCISVLSFVSCQDVISVDLETAPPRLVVEASINKYKDDNGAIQKIKLTTTTGFYEPEVPVVSGAVIYVEDQDGTRFDFIEEGQLGEYVCTDFVANLGNTYTLVMQVEGEVYTASEVFMPVPSIQNVEQTNDIGFGNNTKELKFFYQDNGATDNFYMEKVANPLLPLPKYGVKSNELFKGNMMYGIYLSDKLDPGTEVTFELFGITERYKNYMSKLLIAANNGSGPFQQTPPTVKGNIINQTQADNYALGYFRLSEVSEYLYTVE
jgi:hypothetical protein